MSWLNSKSPFAEDTTQSSYKTFRMQSLIDMETLAFITIKVVVQATGGEILGMKHRICPVLNPSFNNTDKPGKLCTMVA